MKDIERRFRTGRGSAPAGVTDRFAELAEAEGLLDVAYARIESPIGTWIAAATPRGVVRLAFSTEDDVLEELAAKVSPRVLEAPGRLDAVRRELDEYFDGRRRRFDVSLDMRLVRGFTAKVLQRTAAIPFGETRSYGEVAREAGSPRAARAAGNALHSNPVPVIVPCHRVLHADGGLGGYGGGLDRKEYLLRLEGASI